MNKRWQTTIRLPKELESVVIQEAKRQYRSTSMQLLHYVMEGIRRDGLLEPSAPKVG